MVFTGVQKTWCRTILVPDNSVLDNLLFNSLVLEEFSTGRTVRIRIKVTVRLYSIYCNFKIIIEYPVFFNK